MFTAHEIKSNGEPLGDSYLVDEPDGSNSGDGQLFLYKDQSWEVITPLDGSEPYVYGPIIKD